MDPMMSPTQYLDDVLEGNESDEDLCADEYHCADEGTEEEISKEMAVLSWLCTFPQLKNMGGSDINTMVKGWYKNENVLSALLVVASEICNGDNMNLSESSTWNSIADLLGCSYQSDNKASLLAVFYALLCRAVSDTCSAKTTYVSRIIELDRGIQIVLMQIIKEGEEMKQPAALRSPHPDESYLDDLNIDEDNESLLDDFDDNTNKENIVNSTHTPLSVSTSSLPRKSPMSYRSPKFTYRSPITSSGKHHTFNQFSGSRGRSTTPLSASPHSYNQAKVMQLERQTVQLKDANEALSNELNTLRQQESMLQAQLEETEAKNRAIQLKIEAENLAYNNKLRDEYDEKIQSLEKKLQMSEQRLENAASMEEELSVLRDEVDVLHSCKTKMIQAEEQVRKLKRKMEQMGDLNEVLAHEEKAHAEAIAKCLELETSLAVLAPLKRQLEEYKTRATNAEVKLVDCEDEIKKLKANGHHMNDLHKEFQVGCLRQQAEVEDLRRKIQEADVAFNEESNIGHGISEMNPVVKEELLRLRSENKRLKEFAAKRENDAVQMIEEKLDDANRLASKFKEQFLSTKNTLEEKVGQLDASLNRESTLKNDIANLNNQIQLLEKDLKEERNNAKLAQDRAQELLATTKQRMIEQHDKRLHETNDEWERQLKQVQEDLNMKYNNLLKESTEKENHLKQKMTEVQHEMDQSLMNMQQQNDEQIKQLITNHEETLVQLKSDFVNEKEELVKKGKQMIQKIKSEKDEKISKLERDLDTKMNEQNQLIQKQKAYEQKVTVKLASYKQKLQVAETEAQEASIESEQLLEKLKKTEREKATLQDDNERYRRQMTGRVGFDQGQYEALQREYNVVLEENQALKKEVNQNELFTERNPVLFSNDGHLPFSSTNNISAISQLRAEYEEKIEELCDERRQLIMKNSALIADEKRATNHSWDLEVQVKDLQEKNTSLQLQIERLRRNCSSTSKKRVGSKASPKSLTKRAGAWRASKMSPSQLLLPSPTASTLPNLDLKSPEFERSMSKFRTKLITRLNSTEKMKNQDKINVEHPDDQWKIHI